MTKFIVLSGKKQAGKTTAAEYIKNYLVHTGYPDTIITSFATPIKKFCTDVVGLTEAQVYGSNADKDSETHIKWANMPQEIQKRYGYPHLVMVGVDRELRYNLTAREVMQIFGTDMMRTFFDFDIWAKAPFQQYKESELDYVIIDDCRFPNEADMALENGATLIRLTRNVLGEDVHISEKALDDYPQDRYNHVIDNHGFEDVELLHSALKKILDENTF